MRKALMTVLVAGMFSFLSLSAAVVSAQPDEHQPLQCTADIAAADWDLNGEVYWLGPIYGCSIAGTVAFHEHWDENYVVGTTEHFFETFTIWPTAGGWITGADQGVWNFATFKFRANGWVTDASPQWAFMVGYKYHEMGATSSPDTLPITGYGTAVMIVPT